LIGGGGNIINAIEHNKNIHEAEAIPTPMNTKNGVRYIGCLE